jgi:ubiquinone/menaquinone biosynthesis C-methylase UbiE
VSHSFDRVAEVYDRTRGGPDRASRFADRLTVHLPLEGLVLDIGAGTGILTEGIMQRRGGVIGIDIAPKMLALAAARLPGRVVRADAARLPFQDNTFVAAYAVWVLQHVEDLDVVLREAARVLATRGRLVVVTTHQNERDDDIGRLTEPVMRRLAAAQNQLDDPTILRARAESAGMRFETLDWVADHFTGESPRGQIERIEQKTISVLWDLSEPEWEKEVTPLLMKLRALPEQDRRRMIHAQDALLIFSKPDHKT